jgi:two-component system alkaline phosphatase synthesis response regulator PhoP
MSKIMFVDDDEKILHVVRRMLESKGHEVMTTENGKECLEILKSDKPDLILMDVMMPEMDGWEVVREIRKDESNKDIVISMLTINYADMGRAKSLEEADWHIRKPITKENLLKAVDWLLTKQ